jgi:precorrin-2/cobalt-factor-2 C20-methyltransferase
MCETKEDSAMTARGHHHNGRLWGCSLGPGDPGLITRRAWALLQRSDVHWTYPVRDRDHESFALAIACAAGLEPPTATDALVFPMTHDQARLASAWAVAAERVLEVLHRGTDVAFLVEGDASTYSSFGYLARTVQAMDPQIAVETIAGVTSFCASAALLQAPLVDQDERLAVLPAGYGVETIDRLLDEHDTLVLLKVKPLLDPIIELLERRGLLADAAFVERAGTADERVVRDLTRLCGEPVNYLSLILVKNPNRRREQLIRGCVPKLSATPDTRG